jgi:hypothetical protein
VVLGDEDWEMFEALEAALTTELAPQSPLQAVLVRRIVIATWRLERVERMEGELIAQNIRGTTSFGLAMIRDCHGPRAFDTLLRYRGGALAELWRSLRTLKALQAEAAQAAHQEGVAAGAEAEMRIKPEPRRIPGESPAAPAAAPGPVGVRGPTSCPDLAPGPVGVRGPNACPDLAPTPAPASAEPAPAPFAAPASVAAAASPVPRPCGDAGGSAPRPGSIAIGHREEPKSHRIPDVFRCTTAWTSTAERGGAFSPADGLRAVMSEG